MFLIVTGLDVSGLDVIKVIALQAVASVVLVIQKESLRGSTIIVRLGLVVC